MIMNNLCILQKYFPGGRAEIEKDFLLEVFIPPKDYSKIVRPNNRSIRLLVGNKGSGKSCILEYILQKSMPKGIPAILLKPDDIATENFKENTSIAIMKKDIYITLVKAIASKVGETLEECISQDNQDLIEEAITSGTRSPSKINMIKGILMAIGKKTTGIDLKEVIPQNKSNTKKYVNQINDSLEETGFYVLVDDTDQICSPTTSTYLETIWSFILAAQKIAEDVKNAKVIVSLRSEIWRRLVFDNHGARDQIDHFRPMKISLSPSLSEMRKILDKRIAVCFNNIDDGKKYETPWEAFFRGKECKLPSSKARRLWRDYIVTNSRCRPRDIVQLVNSLCTSALDNGKSLIDDRDIENTALKYSQERMSDIINENENIFPQIETILLSFYKVPFELTAVELKEHLQSCKTACRMQLNKRIITNNTEDEDEFVIWRLFRNIEFIYPKIQKIVKGEERYEHISPDDDINLVSQARWNDMNKYTWCVHPCYRSHLIEEKKKNDSRIQAKRSHNKKKRR